MKSSVIGFGVDDAAADKLELFQPLPGMSVDEFNKLASSVVVALPHLEDQTIAAPLLECASQWAMAGAKVLRCTIPHAGFVEVARAGIVRQFLDLSQKHPDVRYLVMMDTDQSAGWDAPFRLAQWDRPVVSGVVCSWSSSRGIYAAFMLKDRNGIARFPSINFTGKMPVRGLVKAHRVGTGLVCIRKDVLERMDAEGVIPFLIPEDSRRESCKTGVIKLGEDMQFCRQVHDLGYDIFVDLSVHAKHYKTIPIQWPMRNLDPSLNVEEWDVSEKDFTI